MPTLIRSGVLSANGAIAPGNQITIGQVGFGWIGGSHLGTMLGRKDVRYVAACDVNGQKLEEVRQRIEATYSERYGRENYHGCAAYRDYRQMLAREDIDAVIIATPDHWHALISIHAAQAGKDIYCEKPMTLTIREARAVVKTVRRYSRVFQTGSQQRSNVFGSFRQACELVRNGRIGKVLSIDVSTGGPPKPCDLPEEPQPDYFDWDKWLGPVLWRPYHSKLAAVSWRPYREFCGGGFADMGAHHFDIAQWALGTDESVMESFMWEGMGYGRNRNRSSKNRLGLRISVCTRVTIITATGWTASARERSVWRTSKQGRGRRQYATLVILPMNLDKS
jgi:predicted dehydrogenase